MNNKKPEPIYEAPTRSCCPVCGKPSYSLGGTHPQCSEARADAKSRATRKANSAAAKRPAKVAWSKPCPKCKQQVPARRFICDCGHHFGAASSSFASVEIT